MAATVYEINGNGINAQFVGNLLTLVQHAESLGVTLPLNTFSIQGGRIRITLPNALPTNIETHLADAITRR